MSALLSYISSFALSFIDKTGYAGVFVLSVVESAAIPIPSEVVIPFSGFLAAIGRFSFWPVVILATLANLTGSLILYWIGKSGGRWIVERYGKYFLIHKKDIERGDAWFKKYGSSAVFFSRMLPVIRTFISLPAGIALVDFKKFVILTFFGALPWNLTLAFIGFKAGENWGLLHDYFRQADVFIVILLCAGVVWYVFKHRRH
ncbi:MAG: hypothetical protein A2925_03455 [Candidatus Yanofskybacteria bacterium RIFCSPLOWO2_01_FULL_44_22]|uniref:VTT domain-containing protein n=2 Tax=Candidatus Yanofskyibacteriota TaxID=1752733 RepID=A0A1F8GLX0_9BACT|nr:MAG: hypothetical protein UW79_C0002G0009 [Candidatus Yanofskybacteria bacterium GW2011_GWA2_44_9]OGN05267.1 MAG: hypothetical protein A2659_04925 [Candidatus Yanofskybacteria bacterium RIFCSPHIGHO2_01_FULL_44_24]OGN26404.1 MAG: hypothetical protein A2925_03455 [Candidatus Yanofskybacteria bacterium RIFCSPLOWO2_01_FULL_44_22]